MTPEILARHLTTIPHSGHRRLVAIVGPPASGKSTLVANLAALDPSFAVVPMDGFHLDNATLDQIGLRDRKGSPDTFDAAGFLSLVQALRTTAQVSFPLFDRMLDGTVPDAGRICSGHTTALIEGNYLLLDQPIWRDLAQHWDVSVFIDTPMATLEQRLMQRWLDHGFSSDDAATKAKANDLPNAQLLQANSLPADIYLTDKP